MTQREFDALSEIYKQVLQDRNCSRFRVVISTNSRIDAMITSATTTTRKELIIEYKRRYSKIRRFRDTFITLDKFEAMKTLAHYLDATALFIVQFDDATLIYQLDFNNPNKYEVRQQFLPNTQDPNRDQFHDYKDVIVLQYADALFHVFQRISWKVLPFQKFWEYMNWEIDD